MSLDEFENDVWDVCLSECMLTVSNAIVLSAGFFLVEACCDGVTGVVSNNLSLHVV